MKSVLEQAVEASWTAIEGAFVTVKTEAEKDLRLIRKIADVRTETPTTRYVTTAIEPHRSHALEAVATGTAGAEPTAEVVVHEANIVGMIDIVRRWSTDRRTLYRIKDGETAVVADLTAWMRGAFEAANRVIIDAVLGRIDGDPDSWFVQAAIGSALSLDEVPEIGRRMLDDQDEIDVLVSEKHFKDVDRTVFEKKLAGGTLAPALHRPLEHRSLALVLPHRPNDIVIHEAYDVQLGWDFASGQSISVLTEQRMAIVMERPIAAVLVQIAP